jgi:hypothetical protein
MIALVAATPRQERGHTATRIDGTVRERFRAEDYGTIRKDAWTDAPVLPAALGVAVIR